MDLEEDLETKNIVTEGLALIDPHDQATTKLAQSLKSGASVNKNTLESPTLEVVVVGAPEPESDEDTDDSLFGKTGEFALIGIAAAGEDHERGRSQSCKERSDELRSRVYSLSNCC